MARIPFRNKRGSEPNDLRGALSDIRSEMNRAVDLFLKEPLQWAERALGLPEYPAVDIAETDEVIVVRAEVPGLDPAALEVTVAGNLLTLAGERREATETDERNVHASEIRYGTFRRQLTLPAPVDAERVTAESRHGIVTIRLPKALPVPHQRVPIQPAG